MFSYSRDLYIHFRMIIIKISKFLIRDVCLEQSGSILILVATTLPLMVGFVALSVDIGLRLVQLEMLQSSADAAAYNGAMAIAYLRNSPNQSYSPSACANEVASVENKLKSINVYSSLVTTTTGCGVGSNYVTVNMKVSGQYQFLNAAISILNKTSSSNVLTTQATSVARITTSNNTYCMLALNPTQADAVYIGGNTTIDSTGCGIAVNSTNDSALHTNGSSSVIKTSISDAGGYTYTGNPPGFTLSYAQPVQDPYAVNGARTAISNFPTSGATNYTAGTSGPGHYTSFTVNNNASINLSPGTYYFDDANIGNNSTITGSDVTIIFSASASFKNIAGSTQFKLSAPITGQYEGIAMASLSKSALNFQGISGFSGALYFPNSAVSYTGNTNPTCIQLVADTIAWNGNTTLNNDLTSCPQFSNNQIVRTVVQLIR